MHQRALVTEHAQSRQPPCTSINNSLAFERGSANKLPASPIRSPWRDNMTKFALCLAGMGTRAQR